MQRTLVLVVGVLRGNHPGERDLVAERVVRSPLGLHVELIDAADVRGTSRVSYASLSAPRPSFRGQAGRTHDKPELEHFTLMNLKY